jgi:hypothetical protein
MKYKFIEAYKFFLKNSMEDLEIMNKDPNWEYRKEFHKWKYNEDLNEDE